MTVSCPFLPKFSCDDIITVCVVGSHSVPQVSFIMRKIAFCSVHQAVNTWREWADETSRYSDVGWQALCKMQYRLLSSAFNKWLAPVGLELSIAWKLTQALNCFQEMQLVRAVNTWHLIAMQKRERWERKAGILRQIMEQSVTKAFNRWFDNAWETKHQAMQLRKSLLYGLERRLSEAWQRWTELPKPLSDYEEKCLKFMLRMMNLKVQTMWDTWYQYSVGERKVQSQHFGLLNSCLTVFSLLQYLRSVRCCS